MENKKCIQVFGASLMFLLLSNFVMAESYLGFGAGEASSDLKPLFGTQELEDSPMLKVFLGFRTDDHALEVDISVGTFDWVNSSLNSHTIVNVSGNVVGFIPMGETFELFGKIGVNLSSTTVEFLGETYEGESGIGLSYGGGLLLNFTEKFALRAEYQGVTGIDDGVDSGSLDWLSLQAVFTF
ncbi:MAG: outer membrane beta-barrel protein [Gammaproteobacteria bacterium]|nr:outer membrane beta-barrel protein [Gammaproteobacteria bacterium]